MIRLEEPYYILSISGTSHAVKVHKGWMRRDKGYYTDWGSYQVYRLLGQPAVPYSNFLDLQYTYAKNKRAELFI